MNRFLLFSFGVLVIMMPPREGHAQALSDMADTLVELAAPITEQAGKRAVHRFTSGRVEATYNGIVVQGFAGGDSLTGWVRFDAGGWGAWQPLYIVRSATDAAFLAAYRGTTYRTDHAFEVRFEVDAGQDLTVLGAGVFDNRRDAERYAPEAGAEPPFRAPDQTSDFLIVAPDLIPRPSWDAESFRGDLVPLNRPDYLYITFHHAAGFGATTLEEGLEQVRRIQDFHQNGRGWSDIGYQFVMDQSGRLYQGRPFWDESVPFDEGPRLALGAHAGGANTGNIGVCVLGCYHPPEGAACRDQMTEAALDSLVAMFAFLSERYGVPPENIRGHRDFSSTACPGDTNYPLLPTVREQTRDLLRTGNRPLGTASMTATVDDDGVVQLSWAFIDDGGIATYQVVRAYDDQETVIFEGAGAVDESIMDTHLARPGDVTYRLHARSATGREQVLAVADIVVERPEGYTLAHSFPNPFQQSTTLRYYLARDGIVTLAVYDVTGRLVASLVEEFQDGGRWYTVRLDGSRLSSGSYYARLQVEGFAGVVFDETRSLALVK